MTDFEQLVLSVRAYKGHFTRKLKMGNEIIENVQGVEPTPFLLTRLQNAVESVSDHYDKLEEGYAELQAEVHDQFDDYETKCNKHSKQKDRLISALSNEIARMEKILNPKLPKPNTDGRLKPADSLKPKTLTKDATPMELAVWLDKFQTYFEASHFYLATTNKEQQGYFLNCVDTYLYSRLQTKIGPATTIFPDPTNTTDSMVELIKNEFLIQHPIFVRRLDYFRTSQSSGQRFSDWSQKLHKMGDEARIDELSIEERTVMRYLTGCTDQELLKEFMKESEPTLKRMDEIVLTHERNKKYEKAMGTKTKANSTNNKNGKTTNQKSNKGAKQVQELPKSRAFPACMLAEVKRGLREQGRKSQLSKEG